MTLKSIDIILASLSKNTYKQYDGCIKAWLGYCKKNHVDYLEASVPTVIDFLTQVFQNGAKYGTINTYKSALSLLLGSMSNDDRLKRFMKGVFRLRPPAPRYDSTWDTNVVLNYLSQKWPNDCLDLKTLTMKTLSLLALVTAHRVQTFSKIKLSNISIIQETKIIIKIPDHIKTSKVNSFQPLLKLPFYNERPEICPARAIVSYIQKTSTLRSQSNEDHLFISFRTPHSKVSSQRLSHWIKDTLQLSGIDTSVFCAHSTRHAATSAAKRHGINLDIIRKTAGWTNSSSTFARFYNREIINDDNQFALSILSNSSLS